VDCYWLILACFIREQSTADATLTRLETKVWFENSAECVAKLLDSLFVNYCILNWTSFRLGTTWVQEIVWQIFNEGQVKSDHINKRIPFLEWSSTNPVEEHPDFDALPSPRILKAHLPYNIVPKSANEDIKCKYIYVARNPKDVAVSFFKFVTSLKFFENGFNGPWEFYAKLFVEGNGKFGN